MIAGLGDQNKWHPIGFQLINKGLVGIQIIAGDDIEFRMCFSDFFNQALPGIALAILFGAAICILNRFRSQRNDLPLAWMNNGRTKKLMGVCGFPGFFGSFLQASGTGDILGEVKYWVPSIEIRYWFLKIWNFSSSFARCNTLKKSENTGSKEEEGIRSITSRSWVAFGTEPTRNMVCRLFLWPSSWRRLWNAIIDGSWKNIMAKPLRQQSWISWSTLPSRRGSLIWRARSEMIFLRLPKLRCFFGFKLVSSIYRWCRNRGYHTLMSMSRFLFQMILICYAIYGFRAYFFAQ